MNKLDWVRLLLTITVQQVAVIFFMRVANFELSTSALLAGLVAAIFALVFSFMQKRFATWIATWVSKP